MKKIYFLIVISFSILFTHCLAQVQQEWVRRYNSQYNMDDVPHRMTLDMFDNIIVTGGISTNNQALDMATVKYNPSGVQQWVTTYNQISTTNDSPTCIASDSSGNIFVAGNTGFNLGPFDVVTIKYNSNGVEQWAKIYAGTVGNTDDGAGDIGVDISGNVYVCGGTGTPIAPNNTDGGAFLIKYNSNGDSVWVRRYSAATYFTAFTSLAIDRYNNIYAAGIFAKVTFPNTLRIHSITVKYDSSGVLQWASQYISTLTNHDYTYELAIDSSGNAFVSGFTYGQDILSSYLTIKYSSSGVQQWVRNYTGLNGDNYAQNIVTDKFGNAYVTGDSYRGVSVYDIATIKYNTNGDSLWVRRYTGPDNNGGSPRAMTIDDSANVYITGNTNSGITTLKYNANGAQQWVVSHTGFQSIDVAIDRLSNVYVTGGEVYTNNMYDYITIKYSQVSGIHALSSQIPDRFKLYQNYPNPFNSSSKFKLQIAKLSEVKVTVYDILGREVEILVNEKLNSGTYEANWDAGNYPSGVYFYKLTAPEFTDTKKMILIK